MWLVAVIAQTIGAGAAPPVVTSTDASERTLTIYRDDLSFVTERRVVDLPAGRSRVIFAGVSDRMVPQTALLTGFDGVTVERNFDQGLLTDASLYASMVGETVLLRRTGPNDGASETIEAEVLAAAQGLIVRTPAGVETLACTGLSQALSAPERPDRLVARPELSIVVDAPQAGPSTLSLAYLADGIGWSADYVLTVANKSDASLRGWLTFTNETATPYTDVPAAIVAGTLQIGDETASPRVFADRHYAVCWPQGTTKGPFPTRRAENPYLSGFPDAESVFAAAFDLSARVQASPAFAETADEIVVTGAKTATEERFGDYRLYRPPGPISLTPYRTKQVAFLDESGLKATARYDLTIRPWDEGDETLPIEAVIAVDNDATGPLGRALPAGTVRVMTDAGGEPFYLGQDDIRDLAVGVPVEIKTGETASVRADIGWMALDVAKFSGWVSRRLDVTWQNDLRDDAVFRLVLPDWVERYERFDAKAEGARRIEGEPSPTWEVTMSPGASRTVTLNLRWRER